MTELNSLTCPRCGAFLPREATNPLCPACLMSGALQPTVEETISHTTVQTSAHCEPTEFPSEFGRYRLLGLLGRGGMGTVFDAQQIDTGRRVALKMLGQQLDSPEMRQRFLREGRSAAGVSHPNSLYVFGSEEIQGVPVITMEVADCGTLKDRVNKRGPLPTKAAVDAILDVIAGLEAAFAAGVLHRDVKPSNCFVSPDGTVKVGDFGLSVSTLAKDDSYVTATGVIMGTPAYASPEQLRGDELDVRADIYSVGATLFTLLTGHAPFEGRNAVQVVAHVVNQKPKALSEWRDDVPPGLERVVSRCLAKEAGARFANYRELRNALLPFSSREPEPASLLVRVSAGWIDFLLAFLPAYIALMFLVGGEALLVQPLVERTLYAARYYFLLLGCGLLYFTILEGIWGAGLGKWLKGLRVVRADNRRPGCGRAFVRILIPILCMEGVRMPLMLILISDATWTGLQTALYVLAAIVCGWIPGLLALRARRDNAFATVWDLASGTRVVIRPQFAARPSIERVAKPAVTSQGGRLLGPYEVEQELVPGQWIIATDPVLRRRVWLWRRTSEELSSARRNVARSGRPRWLQEVTAAGATWDAWEAIEGVPFSRLVEHGAQLPWSSLRYWLHDVASELWSATADQTLPAELGLDHVWMSADGRAVLLDRPWPDTHPPAAVIPVGNLAGQQRFLQAIAAEVESTSVPLHARPVLRNIKERKFEKLSFLTGTLRGLLDKPADVGRGIRAGSLFLLPLYVWIAIFVGYYHDKPWHDFLGVFVIITGVVIFGAALVQLLGLPFRSTVGHSIFRLAVVNADGEQAARSHLLVRWLITWLPLTLPMLGVALWLNLGNQSVALIAALALMVLWIGLAVVAVVHPHRGLHDRLASTWVVRR